MVKAYEDVQLVIRSLQHTRDKIVESHHEWFEHCSQLARKVNVEVKKPRTCQRQRFRQNHTTQSQSPEQEAKDYFRVSLTIPLIDELIERLNGRFSSDQDSVVKGFSLVPSNVVMQSSWKTSIAPFTSFYADNSKITPIYYSIYLM